MWATQRILETAEALVGRVPGLTVSTLREKLLAEALALAEDDVSVNTRIARHGAEIVPHGANILHHCNTGALATVDVGTALGVIYGKSDGNGMADDFFHFCKFIMVTISLSPCAECHKQGKGIHVWVDETRPRLQGSKLTAWELMRGGVPMHLIADNASGHLMRHGKVDIVLFGADRVAENGDVANKVGTYKVCHCFFCCHCLPPPPCLCRP